MRIAPRWMFSTPSSSKGSVGLSGLTGIRQGDLRDHGAARPVGMAAPPPGPAASCRRFVVHDRLPNAVWRDPCDPAPCGVNRTQAADGAHRPSTTPRVVSSPPRHDLCPGRKPAGQGTDVGQHRIGEGQQVIGRARPVSTPTVRIPAARPALRSCRLSPTMTTAPGAHPRCAAKARHMPGIGLRAMAGIAARQEIERKLDPCCIKMRVELGPGRVGRHTQRIAVLSEPRSSGSRGTVGNIGATAGRTLEILGDPLGAHERQERRDQRHDSCSVPAITGLSQEKRRAGRSKRRRTASARETGIAARKPDDRFGHPIGPARLEVEQRAVLVEQNGLDAIFPALTGTFAIGS
jgi:hypothetical protein